MTNQRAIRAWVSGRVQGVFFRDSTRREAVRLGLTGHAINLSDGRVEVLACGSSKSIDELLSWLHHGPPRAIVYDLQYEEVRLEAPSRFRTA